MTIPIDDVRTLSRRLAGLVAIDSEEHVFLDLAVGAAYSLEQALRLSTGRAARRAGGAAEVRATAAALSRGQRIAAGTWLAEYYLSSSVLRLNALVERILNYAADGHVKRTLAMRHNFARLKQDIEPILLNARGATVEDAQNVLRELIVVLELLLAHSGGPSKHQVQKTGHG